MNVRFSENEIRFRISKAEFDKLASGEYLQLETIPMVFIAQVAKKTLEQAMVLDLSCGQVHLIISPEEITALGSRLPSRVGIEKTLALGLGKSVDTIFEVDIK